MKPETIMIDDVKYVREDSVDAAPDLDTDGLPYVVVRSRDQGVMVGYLKEKSESEVLLLRARQVWYWESAFILAEFAEQGPTGNGRISCALSLPFVLANWCGIYQCTKTVGEKIRKLPSYEA